MKQILIVDDTSTNLRILEILLKKCGCEVYPFVSPESCLEWASDNWQNIDLVIVDYQMPGMNGDGLAVKLRRLGCVCHIIILTGYSGLSPAALDQEAKIDAIMNKPISINDVRYILERWSDQVQIMDARRESRIEMVKDDAQEIFIYRDGFYISINVRCINRSEHGIAFVLNANDSGVVSTSNEIMLKSGVNYSVRWSRQRPEGQCIGCCSIES